MFGILKDAEAGVAINDLLRQHDCLGTAQGITEVGRRTASHALGARVLVLFHIRCAQHRSGSFGWRRHYQVAAWPSHSWNCAERPPIGRYLHKPLGRVRHPAVCGSGDLTVGIGGGTVSVGISTRRLADGRSKMRGRRFNNSGGTDCARLLHGGSVAVKPVASGCPPLVYHEQ